MRHGRIMIQSYKINIKSMLLACLVMAICFIAVPIQAQTISGVVTDEDNGDRLPGVNIVVQGTNIGTATDADGNFQLDVPSLNETIVVSYVGYQTKEISINGRETLEITLLPQSVMGDELVVIGYGTQRRADVTGSISTVSSDNFNQGVVSSPEQLLQGKVPGLSVTAQGGQPGAPQTISIRGLGSLRTGSGPLFVIDGVAIDNSNTAPSGDSFGMSTASPTNPLAFLNPDDIESINVLKDASATAIYGSRAANGVILISTKSGEIGQAQLNYSSRLGISKIANRLDLLSPEEFADFHNSNGRSDLDYGNRTNWMDQILRTAYSHEQSLSYSGGNESSTYYASVNYSDQPGILKGSDLEKYGGRLNLTQGFLDNRLDIGVTLSANQTHTDYAPTGNNPGVNGDYLSWAMQLNPTYPTHNPDGSLFIVSDGGMNPLQALDLITNFSDVTRVLGSIEASFEITEGLLYKVNFGLDNSNGSQISQVDRHGIFRIQNPEGRLVDSKLERNNIQTESTLNYLFDVDNHGFDVLGGFSYQKFEIEGRTWSINNFTTTEIEAYHNPGIGSSLTIGQNQPSGFSSVNELQSVFGRVNYDYMNRYFLTATLRTDGSSRFGDEYRYGYFPSFSAAWQLSDELFFDFNSLSNLRLRAGWGQTGTQDIPNGITQQLINVGVNSGYELTPGTITPGITFLRTQNETIRWEVSTQSNLGIDFGFFENTVYGTVDVFRKVSSDILFNSTSGVDPITPTDSFWNNLDMEIINQGLEFTLGFQKNISNDFTFDVNANASFIENEVTKLPVSQILTGAISGQGLSGERVQAVLNNQPIGTFYLLDWVGLDENGENIFRDVNGDNAITNADRIVAGNAIPEFTYGISAFFGYKNLDLNLNFNGVSGNELYWNDQNGRFTMPQLIGGQNIDKIGLNLNESPSNSAGASTRFLHDGSYFRLNNATLGYNLDTSGYLDFIRELRLSVTAQNLFTLTDYPGFDPEVDTPRAVGGITAAGIDATRYPPARTFQFAINLSF